MNIRTKWTAGLAVLAMTASGCGGGGGAGAQTEEGAVEAVLAVQRGVLKGDADALLDHLGKECRDSIDENDVKLAIGFVKIMMSEADFNLDEIGIEATIDEFDGDTASVAVAYSLPDGADDGGFGFNDESIDVVYEDGTWVFADCDFGDTSEAEAEDLTAELEALGYAGTREDPLPAMVGAPVGGGYIVSVDEVMRDAAAYIDEVGGYSSEQEPGTEKVLVRVTVGYFGTDEPASAGNLSFTVVGGSSAVGVDLYGCSSIPEELDQYGVGLMSGGVISGAICGDVPVDDVAGMLLSVEQGYGATNVFFDPTVNGAPSVPVNGTSGPAADGALSEGRNAPIALGTPTEVGDGWTVTITSADLDATQTVLDFYEYADPPEAGKRFVTLDLDMSYDGDEASATPAFVDLSLVGNGNVTSAAGNCQVTVDGELDRYSDVFTGGTASGSVCFVVADADVESLVALVSAGFDEDVSVMAVR